MADDVVIFQKEDLPNLAFPAMEQIRRQGKLCDVTIKVKSAVVYSVQFDNKNTKYSEKLDLHYLCFSHLAFHKHVNRSSTLGPGYKFGYNEQFPFQKNFIRYKRERVYSSAKFIPFTC